MPYVLQADDDQLDRITLQRVLQLIDPEVKYSGFDSGLELVQHLSSLPTQELPDFIFLDLRMPIWDGRKTLIALRSDSRYSGIPIYIWSTGDSASEVDLCKRLGAQDFITKPVTEDDWNDLQMLLTRLLSKSRV